MSASRRQQGWVLAAPALLATAVLFLVPMVLVLLTSLYRREGKVTVTEFSLANYERIWSDATIHAALLNSLEVVAITVVISLLIAFPFAYVIATVVPARWQGVVLLLAVLPFWTSYVVRSYSWLLVLAKNGVVNQTLLATGLLTDPLQLANTRLATVIAFVHFFVMVCALTIYASLRQIPPNLPLAARDLGASGWTTFWRVILPLSLPGVIVGAFLTFVLAIGDFITPQIVGGGTEILLPQLIMLQVSRLGDLPLAAALSLLLLVIVAAVYALAARHLTLGVRR
ncbi:MAG: ABC transporter permease [Actinomycetales bacterium]|nr:ABC transporter permease [Actinomycetales bacterium]